MRRAGGLAGLVGSLAVLGLLGCQPAGPNVRLDGSALTVATDSTVSPRLTCTAGDACRGTAQLRVAGLDGPTVEYSVGAGGTVGVVLPLRAAQVRSVGPGTTVQGQLTLDEVGPADLAPRALAVTVTRTSEALTSRAYRERNWTPTAHDTCSAAFHRSFSVLGPDGKRYPTWHPPTATDPTTGRVCSFGHEHGDDPVTSDIYGWVTDFLDGDPATGRGVPFGAVSEALDDWSSEQGGPVRREDHVGHKVVVADDVRLVTASPRAYLRDAGGATVTCDFLIQVHQGSHSGDALINNAHELLYAARCTDGTALISSTLSRFGDPNEFNRSCSAQEVLTAGSTLPAGDGGSRLIPDRFCIDRDVLVPPNQTSSIWALYEVWKSANALTTASGSTLASFDPWFGVRNPARAHAGGAGNAILDLVDVTDMTDPTDGGTAHGYPFDEVSEHEGHTGAQLGKQDPVSPFDGAQRDHYLHGTTVANAGGPTIWYTDPYGGRAVTAPGPGLVRQYVSSTDNRWWPDLERRSFNLEKDYGRANGVHAPN